MCAHAETFYFEQAMLSVQCQGLRPTIRGSSWTHSQYVLSLASSRPSWAVCCVSVLESFPSAHGQFYEHARKPRKGAGQAGQRTEARDHHQLLVGPQLREDMGLRKRSVLNRLQQPPGRGGKLGLVGQRVCSHVCNSSLLSLRGHHSRRAMHGRGAHSYRKR
jgi:hypothetical protein